MTNQEFIDQIAGYVKKLVIVPDGLITSVL